MTNHWLVRHGGFIVVALLAGLVCFTGFRSPLQEPQEARYAEIPRQMLATDNFVVPVLHGQAYYDKPPLFYWLVMASYAVFGVHDWAARLVGCGVAFLCVLVVHEWGRRTLGARGALLGAVVLCLSPRFVQLGRMVTMDGLLCLCVVAAWAAAHLAMTSPARLRWWVLSALACGLGLLTKGPVALVLVLVPVVAWSYLDRNLHRPTLRMLAGYVAVSVALAAPWFITMALRDPSFLEYFFWRHHVERFVDPFDHEEPFWYYLPELLGGMLPWTLLLPGAAWAARRDDVPGLRGFLVPALWCLAFFSLGGCKRAFYILPAMPALALALGSYLDAGLPDADGWRALVAHRSARGFGLLLAALVLGLGGFGAAMASGLLPMVGGVTASALLVIVLALAVWSGKQHGWQLPLLPGGAMTAVLVLAGLLFLLPSYSQRFSLRGQLAGRKVDAAVPVYTYPRGWDSVSFYLQRDDVRVYSANRQAELLTELERQPGALLFIKAKQDDLTTRLPPPLAFVPAGRQGALLVGRVVRREAGERLASSR